jgi:hypothetical protein
MRTLHLILPRRIPSRRRLVKTIQLAVGAVVELRETAGRHDTPLPDPVGLASATAVRMAAARLIGSCGVTPNNSDCSTRSRWAWHTCPRDEPNASIRFVS